MVFNVFKFHVFKLHNVFIRIFLLDVFDSCYCIGIYIEHFCNQFSTTSHNYFIEHWNFKELNLNSITIIRPGLSAFCPAGSYQHCDPIQIFL